MKQMIFVSAALLTAAGIYGFFDYRGQSKNGKLDALYHDDKYNAKADSMITIAVVAKDATKQKEIDVEDFSRKPIADKDVKIEEVGNSPKLNKKTIEQVVNQEEQPLTENIEIKDTTKPILSVAQSVSSKNLKKGEIVFKANLFSRAPLPRKLVKEDMPTIDSSAIAVKALADSTAVFVNQ